MKITKHNNFYDVTYKTKSGRLMVAKRIAGQTENQAKELLKKKMRASETFDSVISAIKL